MRQTVGILGLGQVGRAIKKLALNKFQVYCRDLKHDQLKGNTIDILHLCIPYTQQFIPFSLKTIKELKPRLIIVDSTVKPGTTRQIFNKTKIPIAHVPIMGVHPDLAKYQKMFTKVIGAVNDKSYRLARVHWLSLGAKKIVRFNRPEEAELAKLLSTTYYLSNIVFNKVAKELTQKTKTNYNQVYTKFNRIYNQGYQQINPDLVRQILKFMSGPVGGHCVIPNAQILNQTHKHPLVEFLLQYNARLERSK